MKQEHGLEKIIDKLWKLGIEEGFRVIRSMKGGNVDYDWAREISNSRFDLSPSAIAFPKTAAQVAGCVTFCVKNRVPLRVRSGGHQHEGMSSLENGVVIRLSELNAIEYRGDHRAWIGVGKPLKEIYDELQLRGKTIPGGGCWSVNVGGLALGGGWGTSARKMGLTCDHFDEVEMVTAGGDVIRARADNEHRDLFWALRGGGGGNFGIVTRFLFRLSDIGPDVTSFWMEWKEPTGGTEEDKENFLVKIVHDYLERQSALPRELTAGMGLRVRHRFMEEGEYFPVGLGGKFYGSKTALREALASFMEEHPPSRKSKSLEPEGGRRAGIGSPNTDEGVSETGAGVLLSDLINEVAEFIHFGAGEGQQTREAPPVDRSEYIQKPPPSTTCLAPWPHKISSGFPKNRHVYSDLARKAIRFIRRTNETMPDNAARLYMVLHDMPGEEGGIEPWDSAFFWRDKDILVQFQAWWAGPCLAKGDDKGKRAYERDETRYLCWIRAARQNLNSELEGAFINFIDRDLPLETYYGDNFARLREIKKRYDQNDVFGFPMGIPLEDASLNFEAITRWTPSGFEVVTRDDSKYDTSRRISNALFDLRPLAIAYPWKAEHVSECIRYCREKGLQLRICSGGHQHEGMCSADNVLMVRLSEMKCIEYVDGPDDQAWIGVGAALEDVYGVLQERGQIIAAGGCKRVNIGGLTLGGGWGLSARRFGLACDNVDALEVVLADGRVVVVEKPKNGQAEKYSDLFWALLGGGGGNFGIVTRFLVRLHTIKPNLSKYKLYWKTKGTQRQEIIKRWLAYRREEETEVEDDKQSTDTTSYLVLYADLQAESKENKSRPRYSVYAGGMSYNDLTRLKTEVKKLATGMPKVEKSEFEQLYPASAPSGASAPSSLPVGNFLDYAETPPGHFDLSLSLLQTRGAGSRASEADCRTPLPKENCVGSHPHKVTSAFPVEPGEAPEDYEANLAEAISTFLDKHPVSPNVKSYISLYSMGGAVAKVKPKETAFWYRDRPFVIQIESWWSYPDSEPESCDCRSRKSWQQEYIDWVRNFRDTLQNQKLVEGAFINFIDKDLEEAKDRKKLLQHYYGGNLERLMQSKAKWDPTDFFHFEMSIPLS